MLYSIFMNVMRFRMIHVRLVVESGSASLYGTVWAMCICGIGVMTCLDVPLLSSVSTFSLPCMPMSPQTF